MARFQIFWFSGTGNTLLAARVLAQELEAGGRAVEMVDMAACRQLAPQPDSTLVICWPVYAWGMPRLVANYVAALPESNAKAALLCTMGGGAGGALAQAARMLTRKGFEIIGAKAVVMPNNYPGGRIPHPVASSKVVEQGLVAVREFARSLREPKQQVRWGSGLLSRPVNRGFQATLPLSRRWFKVGGNCTGCRLCYRVCPVANISIEQGRPAWGDACEQCLRCLHLCPEGAIGFMNALGRGRPQYIAPGVDKMDFILRD